jgi:hypothetical protein
MTVAIIYATTATKCEMTIRDVISFFVPALSYPYPPPYNSVSALSPDPFFFFFFFFFAPFDALLILSTLIDYIFY